MHNNYHVAKESNKLTTVMTGFCGIKPDKGCSIHTISLDYITLMLFVKYYRCYIADGNSYIKHMITVLTFH